MKSLIVCFVVLMGLLTLPDKTRAIGESVIGIKPKKYKVGDSIRVRATIIYPQHTGFGKDKKGRILPTLFIKKVQVYYIDKVIISMELTPYLSQNPFIEFKVKVTKAGLFKIVWTDNHGRKFVKSIKIKPTR